MSDPVPVLRERLGRLVRFEPADRPLEDVVDELRALHLYALRNEAPPAVVEALARGGHLGTRALALRSSCCGMEEAIGHNFRAMVYATLDHALVRTILATSNWNLFTVLSTGASFVLDRLSEYAYVQSARAQRDSVVRNLHGELVSDLWEAVAHNPRTVGLSWEECQAYLDLVRRVRTLLATAPDETGALALCTLLLYTTMAQALQALAPPAATPD